MEPSFAITASILSLAGARLLSQRACLIAPSNYFASTSPARMLTLNVASQLFPPPYARGVEEAVAQMQGNYLMGILSSGVDLVADHVAQDLGLSFAWANRLAVVDGYFAGTSEIVVDLWSKADVLERLAAEHDLDLQRICFVGDNVNDLPVLQRVGLAIAANPKDDVLHEVADHIITDFAVLPGLIRAYEASA